MSEGSPVSMIDRYTKRWVTLPDGREIYGRYPGTSSVTLLEHRIRDDLARHVRGVTEAVLPYGRVDVLTSDCVFEVESAAKWRNGVRQALAYAAQTGLPPTVALFGTAHRDQVLKIYLKLRDGRPAIGLWWYTGWNWERVSSRAACRNMQEPQPEPNTEFDAAR